QRVAAEHLAALLADLLGEPGVRLPRRLPGLLAALGVTALLLVDEDQVLGHVRVSFARFQSDTYPTNGRRRIDRAGEDSSRSAGRLTRAGRPRRATARGGTRPGVAGKVGYLSLRTAPLAPTMEPCPRRSASSSSRSTACSTSTWPARSRSSPARTSTWPAAA